jgi:excisionase family DNA binding protein
MSVTELLTTQEAAQLLGVNDSWIRQLRLRGELSGVKRGPVWFFTRAHVEAYKQAREAQKGAKSTETKST